MSSTEEKLKERIKELSCLYEVTSIIVNSDFDNLNHTFNAIATCLQQAWKYPDQVQVALKFEDQHICINPIDGNAVSLSEDIYIFNQARGLLEVSYPANRYRLSDFLPEEKQLLENVSLAVGNHLEKKEIRDNEMAVKRQVERVDRLHILGEITAGIAHELNTPLANILGFAELLKQGGLDAAKQRDLDKIIGNAIFSREVVKKLMFFACEMPQQMKSVILQPIIEDVVKLLAPSLQKKQLEVHCTYSQPEIKLKADPIQLTQVLFNLIMNAQYYSPPKGKIKVDLLENSKGIVLKIADQGEGIPPSLKEKIFEPFYSTKPVNEGSGLGLSVVHGIITSHKGSISYSDNSPKGAIFTLQFPKQLS